MTDKKRELVAYLIFGVLATIVYLLTRFLMLSISGNNTTLSLSVAQIVAILFAFVTNKLFVFDDKHSEKNLFLQFAQFLSGRLLGWGLDLLISFICIEKGTAFFVQLFHLHRLNYEAPPFSGGFLSKFIGSPELINQFFWTMVIQVLIIVMNYVISKFIVFKKEVSYK